MDKQMTNVFISLSLSHRVVFHNAACQPSVFLLDDCLCALHIEEENYQMSSLFTSSTGKPASTSLDPGLSFNSPPGSPSAPPPWANLSGGYTSLFTILLPVVFVGLDRTSPKPRH